MPLATHMNAIARAQPELTTAMRVSKANAQLALEVQYLHPCDSIQRRHSPGRSKPRANALTHSRKNCGFTADDIARRSRSIRRPGSSTTTSRGGAEGAASGSMVSCSCAS